MACVEGAVASNATIVASERIVVLAAPAAAAVPRTIAGVAKDAPDAPIQSTIQLVPPSGVDRMARLVSPSVVSRVPFSVTDPPDAAHARVWTPEFVTHAMSS